MCSVTASFECNNFWTKPPNLNMEFAQVWQNMFLDRMSVSASRTLGQPSYTRHRHFFQVHDACECACEHTHPDKMIVIDILNTVYICA